MEYYDKQTQRKVGKIGWGGREDRKLRQKTKVRAHDRDVSWLLTRQFNEGEEANELDV